jgi:hypothetical protein
LTLLSGTEEGEESEESAESEESEESEETVGRDTGGGTGGTGEASGRPSMMVGIVFGGSTSTASRVAMGGGGRWEEERWSSCRELKI